MPTRLLLVPVLLVLLAAVAPRSAPVAAQGADQGADELAEAYHAAAAAGDHDALVVLWRAQPGQVLVTIDADLEQSLSLRETPEPPDEALTAARHARALVGARAATVASGHPIFVHYVTAFTSWNAEQRKQFRAGQAAFRRAAAAIKAGDMEAAAQAAAQCLELAEPLGDWWGTAMGHTALGRARLAAGDGQAALLSLSRARMLHHDLGLNGPEYSNLVAIADACEALGASARERQALREAIALGQALGDDDGVTRLQARLAALEQAQGAPR
jgi:hypothetical protein